MTLLPGAWSRRPIAPLTAGYAAALITVLTAGLSCGCSSQVPVNPAARGSPPPLTAPGSSPAQPLPTATGGRAHTSTIAHWGAFFGGRPGQYDVLTSPAQVQLPGTIVQVGTSNSTQYALLANGRLYAWGMGTRGELGDGHTVSSFRRAVRVRFPPGVTIAWIPADVMPYDTGLAVDTHGNVWGWGRNAGGELCTGKRGTYLTPVRVPLGSVTAVAGASNHALYDSGGTVYACGQNTDGDLGDGSHRSTTRPVRVAGLPGPDVTQLVASFANSGALLADGRYYDWGYNADGQLGDGRVGPSAYVPVRAHLPRRVRLVAQGGSIWGNGQTLVQLSDGSVWAWGANHACQLGNGRYASRGKPLRVRPPHGVRYRSLATGSATSYAISTTGDVWAWGASHLGQVGNGAVSDVCQPARIISGTSLISATANNVVVSLSAGN